MVTVHAGVESRALHVDGLVLLAGDIRNGVLVDPSIGNVGVTTIACASIATVNQCLNGRNNVTLGAC